MRARRQLVLIVYTVFASLMSPAIAHGQVDQSVLAEQLLGQDKSERQRALGVVRLIPPAETVPELRAALITLLERQNQIVETATTLGKAVANFADPEFIAHLSQVVAALQDPVAIPALSRAIYGGVPVIRALAEFGEQAVPAVLAVVTSPLSYYDAVNHGLLALRFIVAAAPTRPLSAGSLEQIRDAARQRLVGRQHFTTLWGAIDLAVALKDPALRQIVQSLASNRNAVIARGVSDPELIERTQKHAAERLAGIPPLPRR